MREIWFIRHGESESNAGLRSKTPGSPPLTLKGQEQAKSVAGTVLEKPDLIVRSSYHRTIETAAPTVKIFPQTPLETWPIEEFTYLSSKSYKNSKSSERFFPSLSYWLRGDPDYRDGPGAESFNDLLYRAQETIEKIENNSDKFLLIFSHGWFMRAILYSLFTQKNGKSDYQSDIVHHFRKNNYISPTLKTYLSYRKIPPEKKKMLHYIAFSSFRIPNTAILKFQCGKNNGLQFIERDIQHIPQSLKSSFLFDR